MRKTVEQWACTSVLCRLDEIWRLPKIDQQYIWWPRWVREKKMSHLEIFCNNLCLPPKAKISQIFTLSYCALLENVKTTYIFLNYYIFGIFYHILKSFSFCSKCFKLAKITKMLLSACDFTNVKCRKLFPFTDNIGWVFKYCYCHYYTGCFFHWYPPKKF